MHITTGKDKTLDAVMEVYLTRQEEFRQVYEAVEEIKKIVSTLKVGDKTNFGKVISIGAENIEFKAKDTPKTKIAFKARKMGSKDYILDKLIKLKEEVEDDSESLDEANYKAKSPKVNLIIDKIDSLSGGEMLDFWKSLQQLAFDLGDDGDEIGGDSWSEIAQSLAKIIKQYSNHVKK